MYTLDPRETSIVLGKKNIACMGTIISRSSIPGILPLQTLRPLTREEKKKENLDIAKLKLHIATFLLTYSNV